MKENFDEIDTYNNILKAMADKIDVDEFNEVSDYLGDQLMLLTCQRECDDKWFEDVEKLTCQAIEFMNLCAIKSTQNKISTAIIQVVVRLCELQRNVYLRRAKADTLKFDKLSISDFNLLDAGEFIIAQEPKYWWHITDLFNLDKKEIIKSLD